MSVRFPCPGKRCSAAVHSRSCRYSWGITPGQRSASLASAPRSPQPWALLLQEIQPNPGPIAAVRAPSPAAAGRSLGRRNAAAASFPPQSCCQKLGVCVEQDLLQTPALGAEINTLCEWCSTFMERVVWILCGGLRFISRIFCLIGDLLWPVKCPRHSHFLLSPVTMSNYFLVFNPNVPESAPGPVQPARLFKAVTRLIF